MRGENHTLRATGVLLCAAFCTAALAAQEPVVENYPNGFPHRTYSVDAEGLKHGKFQSFFASGGKRVTTTYHKGRIQGLWREYAEDGKTVVIKTYRYDVLNGNYQSFYPDGAKKLATVYRDGQLHGRYKQYSADQSWQREAKYKAGKLHGKVTIKRGRKIVSRQKWSEGEILDLDGMRPFTRSTAELRVELAEILGPPNSSELDASDPKAATRDAALRRLQAYRYLCGLRYEDLELVPKWNDLCDAAGEVCRANGDMSHTPPKPSGFDEARYAQGYRGANKSNLSGRGMVHSVDSYMDDSDPSNIERVGHRRWCLNPAMKLTAFGGADGYSAMWAMDSSGSTPRGMEAVYFPPRGKVPVAFFDSHYAWSIAVMRGPAPKKEAVKITVHQLDEFFEPVGDALELNHLVVARSGYGTGKCVVFRPVGVSVQPGARYLTRVSFDGGKTEAYRYLIEFCDAGG